jgi:predicted MFS family arabinose efflux permease
MDSLSYLLSACALLSVRQPLQQPQTKIQPSLRSAIREGLRVLWHHPTLRTLMVVTTIVDFLQEPLSLFGILVAQQRLGLSPVQIGLIFGVAGGTAVLGSVLAAWLYRPERLGPIMLGSLIVWVLSALTLALAADSLTLTIGWALTQLVWPVYAVAVVSYRLAETPDHLQGRVISAFRALSYGAEPVGLALGGRSVAVVGPSVMVGIIGIGLLSCLRMIIRFSFGTSSQTTSPSE